MCLLLNLYIADFFWQEKLSVIMKEYTTREVSSLFQGFVYQQDHNPSVVQPRQSEPGSDPVWDQAQDEAQLCLLAEGRVKQAEYSVTVQVECESAQKSIKKNLVRFCDKCGKCFHSLKLYNVHVYQTHPEDYLFECLICKKKYAHKFQLAKHSRDDHSTSSFKCQYCNRLYKSKRALVHHCKTYHPS